jgi:cytoskeletal protein CcmA (bactofilin family)
MFSKPKINDPIDPARPEDRPAPSMSQPSTSPAAAPTAASSPAPSHAAQPKPAPSTISSDLTVTGNITTTGDMQVDGVIEGDIRAHLLTVGEGATISGEIIADDIVINGHIRGRVRGIKVRLTSTARVEGDIIHKTIAIESGAHFEGSVQRRDDPLNEGAKPAPAPVASAPRKAEDQPKPAAQKAAAGE